MYICAMLFLSVVTYTSLMYVTVVFLYTTDLTLIVINIPHNIYLLQCLMH